MAPGSSPSGNASESALVSDIESARDHLASTIDQIVDKVSPKQIAARETTRLKARFVGPDGSPRLETIVPVVGVVVGAVVLVVALRKFLH